MPFVRWQPSQRSQAHLLPGEISSLSTGQSSNELQWQGSGILVPPARSGRNPQRPAISTPAAAVQQEINSQCVESRVPATPADPFSHFARAEETLSFAGSQRTPPGPLKSPRVLSPHYTLPTHLIARLLPGPSSLPRPTIPVFYFVIEIPIELR